MRRALATLVAVVLALMIAAPASAAPVNNPRMDTWEIVCPAPIGTYVVTAKGVPGWPTGDDPGTTPILLRAATMEIWSQGVMVEGPYAWSAPPGLESKVVGPCLLHLYGGSRATFDIRSEQTWFQFP